MNDAFYFGTMAEHVRKEELDKRKEYHQNYFEQQLAKFDNDIPLMGEVVNPDHILSIRLPPVAELLATGFSEQEVNVLRSLVSLFDRKHDQCAYPSATQDGMTFMCGLPTVPMNNCSWCSHHLKRIFNVRPRKYGGKGS